MRALAWDAILEGCVDASEAVIVAPYIKVNPLTTVLDQLRVGASIECFTRWTPRDIQAGVSDISCRTVVVERGGAFWLHNRLHAKYYRFDNQVLVGSANMTASGLSYPRYGNLEILCEPGPPFDSAEFEAVLKRESSKVTDDDFRMWQQSPLAQDESLQSMPRDIAARDPNEWIPRTRDPRYLWQYYIGNQAQIVSDEQRALASKDLLSLEVPLGLTIGSFHYWIRLCLQSSAFIDSIRQFDGRDDAFVWDVIATEWNVTRSVAARWLSTAHNWIRYFDRDVKFIDGIDTQGT